METHRQESIGRRVSVTGEGVGRLNNLEHHVSEETNVRKRLTHLSANMLLPLQSHSGSLMLVIDGEHIRIELVSHDYIQILPVWEHIKDVTCKGYCRMKDTDENISHIRKSTVVKTSRIPCTISGVSSVKNINVMRHAPDGFTFDS
ncbi:hypothetical protein DPMN_031446 [Dreissena polymorpha]|uniref:Uncharacterized protein n=1 Tax=Dreissena polymorpha TaxID=45954 RepID=A0A9D4RI22_DREPO|nr:hypothetical protein DPMN_031446 [Dreissena polymorpha]